MKLFTTTAFIVIASISFAQELPKKVSHKKEAEKVIRHDITERGEIAKAVIDLLKKTDGLLYSSESDEVLEVFVRPVRPNEKLTKLFVEDWGANGNDKITLVPFDSFFNHWADQAEAYDIKDGTRVQDIESFFTKTAKPTVFRVNDGKVRVTILVVGQIGNYFIGIRTVSTETG